MIITVTLQAPPILSYKSLQNHSSIFWGCLWLLMTTKLVKSQRQPKILKEYSPLLHSEKTPHKELPNSIINNAKYVM